MFKVKYVHSVSVEPGNKTYSADRSFIKINMKLFSPPEFSKSNSMVEIAN